MHRPLSPALETSPSVWGHNSQIAVTLGTGRLEYLATELVNHVGDINLGIYDPSRSFRLWLCFRNSSTRLYTSRCTLIEPKYLPSAHCTARPIMVVPHRDKSTITPCTGTCAFMAPRGVDQRSDQCPMSLSFIVGAPIASPSAENQGCAKIYDA